MQTGLKAGLAIVLAVFLTGIVGFLTAVTPEDEERTYYTQVSDLTPVIDYTAIDNYQEYNPISNVTGWADNAGVTIPFKEGNGITAYIYHHYISSEQQTYSANVYQSGIMEPDWSGSLDAATWYPLANVITQDSVGSVTDQHVTMERVSAGHVTVRPDNWTSSARSFSVYFGLYTGEVLEHGFTLTFEKGGAVSSRDISISTIADFKSWSSSWWKMTTAEGFYASVDVDIPLGSNQTLYAAFITADTIDSSGISQTWLNLANGKITDGNEFDPKYDYVEYNGGLSYKSASFSSMYAQVINNIKVDGTQLQDWDSDNAYAYMSLEQLFGTSLSSLNDGTTVYAGRNQYYVGVKEFDSELSDSGGHHIIGEFTLKLKSVNGNMVYSRDDESWYPAVLSKNGLYYEADKGSVGYASDMVFILSPGYHKSFSVPTSYPIKEYKYVEGDRFVSIANDVTGYWMNFTDAIGGSVNSTPYQNGMITLLTHPGTQIYSDTVYWKDDGGNVTKGTMSLTVPASIPYSMARVTLDFQSGLFYAQGIVWGAIDEGDRTAANYTLRPYQYPITPTFTKGGDATSDSPTYAEGLQFSKSGGTKVYVQSTYVQIDPLGKLWGNPAVYLGYYFPDYFEYMDGNTGIPNTPLRLLFNGFVSYGTSMSINGQTMPISDGNITFTYYVQETTLNETATPPTEITTTISKEATMPIKGMAVDWEDGHVYLVFTEKGKTRYDLGEYNTTNVDVVLNSGDTGKDTVLTDTIYANGTWYWQSGLYTISHETETVLHLNLSQGLEGWGMSIQTTALLFVGMLLLGVAIVHYYYRDSDDPMGILDWVIIGLAILLTLGAAMI